MPLPPVVVEVTADASPREAAALIEACGRSLPERGCRLATGQHDSGPRGGVALVRRRGENTIVIELGVRRERQVRWVLREIDFRSGDPPEERWRAAGLVIGTLVGQAEAASEPERSAPSPPRAVPRREPERHAPRPERKWKGELGLDALAGPALESGAWRFGAGLTADYRLGDSAAFIQLGLRYAERGADARGLSLNFASALAGAGLEWDLGPRLLLQSSAAALVERVGASIDAPGGGSDSGARFAAGGRLGVALVVFPAEFLGILAGVEGAAFTSPTRLIVAGQSVGQVPNPSYGFVLGVRSRWF
jgi:hypothetical protein